MLATSHAPRCGLGAFSRRHSASETTTTGSRAPMRCGPSSRAKRKTSDKRAFASLTVQTLGRGEGSNVDIVQSLTIIDHVARCRAPRNCQANVLVVGMLMIMVMIVVMLMLVVMVMVIMMMIVIVMMAVVVMRRLAGAKLKRAINLST